MHALEKGGNIRAALVNRLLKRKDYLIGALLLGNNLVNILASVLATSIFLDLFGEAGIVIATVVMTLIVVIFAEVLPKSWAISNADRFAMLMAPIIRFFVVVLMPLTVLVTSVVRALLHMLGTRFDINQSILTAHDELRGTVEMLHQDGSVVKDDKDRFGGLLNLNELNVSDIMIHRTQILSINSEEFPQEQISQILSSPYSRMPVWKGESENIIGVLHTKDLLRHLAHVNHDVSKIDIIRICSTPWFVPESTNLKSQLNAFLRRKMHFALVVDEYGEVQGLVTLEDILEEIVGEITDEYDDDVQGITNQADGSFLIDGSVPIRDINRVLDWNLPDEEATTIAGLVIHAAQIIPDEQQTFTFYNKRFVITKRDKNCITQIKISNLTET